MTRVLFSRTTEGSGTPSLSEWLAIGTLAILGVALAAIAASVRLDPLAQMALAGATIVLFAVCNRRPGRPMTLFLTALSALVSLRYILWRFTETLEFNTVLQSLLGTGLALAEVYATLVLALGYIQTVWPLERKPIPLPDDPADWPTVDIYVPTYNEDLSIVRATVLAAMAIDWPREKLRVYILDDGRRAAFRDFAESCGAGYIIRPDNTHAKAGNLNHAMTLTDGEFITVFDCDHIPTRGFLQLTVGWLVRHPLIAFIQTPHHFYSPDPFQRNLAAGTRVPPEGNMFYGLVQDGNDFWNAAFFCGSCAIIRRTALESIGGFATQTVTEDAHTALRLHRKGWHSGYLRLPLAAGLATERLILHVGQRVRWARGMLQILRLDNPLLGPGLSLGQRLCYLNAMMHFFFALPRLVFLTAPLAFLLLGQNIISASPWAIVAYALPHIFHSIATNARIQGNWRHSFWSEIYETVLALFLVRITLVTLISPRRGRFNVTEKGGLLSSGYFDIAAVYPNLILCGVLMVGLLRGLYGMVVQETTQLEFQAFLLNSIWVTFSVLTVMAALAVGRETRQIRNRARVPARLPAVLYLPDGRALQAVSQDISLGGVALAVDRPDDLPDDGEMVLEFSFASERLILPIQVEHWRNRVLHASWRVAEIADEIKVVRLVFGRADAWVDWDRYPKDRPMVSLWQVLVSILGLFRPAGRPLVASDLPAATAPVAIRSGTLTPQSLVLRPRTATRTARAASVLIISALAGLAHPAWAQSPPAMNLRPLSPPAAPFSGLQLPATSSGAGAEEGDTRTVTFTMRELGAAGPMTMRGTSTIQGLLFGIRADEVVVDARLTLSGAMSPSLLADSSNVTITLNEQYVGTIPVNPNRAEFGPLEMAVNPVFFQDRNRLNFRFTGRYTQECNDPLSGMLWATVSDASTLTLTIVRVPPRRDLARLPLPLFDRNVQQKLTLPFVLPANPGNETLQAAAIVASWFGKLTDFRGVSFPVSAEPPAEGNAVVIASAGDTALRAGLPSPGGPSVSLVPNPNDPLGTLLVVTGRSAAELITAANALSLGSRLLSGERATVDPPALPIRKPYDAPAWISTERPVRFGEMVDASALQGTGYVPGTFHVPFRTAPDLYTWRQRPFQADIRFRAPPGPIIDVAASRLDVSINSIYLRSYSLAPTDSTIDWALRNLGFSRPVRFGTTPVPLYTVFGQNDLQMYFDARPLHRGDCVAIPQDIHLSVDVDSTLDLTSAHHFTVLPNLAFFVNSGFPFTRMADLAETAVVLPRQPTATEVSAFLDLAGYLGSLTFQPVNRLTVMRPGELPDGFDKDILVIGTLAQVGPAADLLERSPYRVENSRLQVQLPNALQGIWYLFGDRTGEERQRAAVALTGPLGERTAALIGTASPLAAKRSVVALLGGSPQGLKDMIEAMRDIKLTPEIQGDLALLAGGSITSYRGGDSYTVGRLPVWLWPEWMLQDQPVGIFTVILVGAAVLSICLHRVLRWRALRRVTHRHTLQE
ncbi:MAG: UDP-forming cellulose synthase catalytic subunit [Acetobacteraceae bacterium]